MKLLVIVPGAALIVLGVLKIAELGAQVAASMPFGR